MSHLKLISANIPDNIDYTESVYICVTFPWSFSLQLLGIKNTCMVESSVPKDSCLWSWEWHSKPDYFSPLTIKRSLTDWFSLKLGDINPISTFSGNNCDCG